MLSFINITGQQKISRYLEKSVQKFNLPRKNKQTVEEIQRGDYNFLKKLK